ncbi:MAG: hypothetical protein WC758_00895 [Candidatus Woesearchaeota archaeon]|jgi:hypothetical protein
MVDGILFDDETMNSMLNRTDTKAYKKEKYLLDLGVRVELSSEDLEIYGNSIDKKILRLYYCAEKIYENSGYEQEISSLKVSTFLVRSIAQYVNKPIDDVTNADLLLMYKSIKSIFKEDEFNNSNARVWRKVNNLTSFGCSQYSLMENYVALYLAKINSDVQK